MSHREHHIAGAMATRLENSSRQTCIPQTWCFAVTKSTHLQFGSLDKMVRHLGFATNSIAVAIAMCSWLNARVARNVFQEAYLAALFRQ